MNTDEIVPRDPANANGVRCVIIDMIYSSTIEANKIKIKKAKKRKGISHSDITSGVMVIVERVLHHMMPRIFM